MKKFFAVFILICFCNLSSAYAAEKSIFKIVKNNKKYELVEKSSDKKILPFQYEKIRKIKYDKKIIYIGENKNYITLYSPDGIYNDFAEKYYQTNILNNSLKFINYPKNTVIIYKQNKKYGIIAVQNNILHITKPLFDKIGYPDSNSMVSMILNTSFAPYDSIIAYYNYSKGNYNFISLKDILANGQITYSNTPIILNHAEIHEDLSFNDGILTVKYNNFTFPLTYKFINNTQKTDINNEIYSLEDIYDYLNSYTNTKVINYPNEGNLQTGYRLYAFENGTKYDITVPCSDYFNQNSLLKDITGIKINFNNNDNIIAKNGNWGIINKNNEIKTPFIYDKILPIGGNINETAVLDGNKTVLKYSASTNKTKYFLVKKGFGRGIIDENNNIIIPFEYKQNNDNNEINQLKAQINKKIQYDCNKAEGEGIKENLPYFILDLLFLPFWIIIPFPFSFYAHIDYF